MRVNKVLKSIAPALLFSLAQVGWAADALDTWSNGSSGSTNAINAATYGNGQFVAVGYSGTIVTSPDGAAWTPRDSGTPNGLLAVAFAGGHFVAVGLASPDGTPTIVASSDGAAWSPAPVKAGTIATLAGVAYGAGTWVAVGTGTVPPFGGTGAKIITSVDGSPWATTLSWSTNNPSLPSEFTKVAYGNGRFVALLPSHLDLTQATVAASTDGVNWTVYPGLAPQFDSGSVIFANGLFVGVGWYQTYTNRLPAAMGVIWTSADGIHWTRRVAQIAALGPLLQGVSYGGGQFLAVGHMAYSSADGINWLARNSPFPGGVDATVAVYGGGQFIVYGPPGVAVRSGVIGKLGASLSADGQFLGSVSGVTGQNYTIESSSNLADWMALTNVTLSDGTAQFSDAVAAGASRRFYKALIINQ